MNTIKIRILKKVKKKELKLNKNISFRKKIKIK